MHGDMVSITDVCDFQGGSQPPKNEWSESPKDGYIRMLQIRDFTQGKKEHIAYVKKSNKIRECIESDVLIGRYGASVGKILTGLAGAYNVAIMKTVPNTDKLDTRFLYFLLKSPHFQNFILNVGVRAAQAGFSKKDLKKYKVFLPQDKNDQIKIANLLTQVETLIAKREESIELLDELLKSTFLDMFGDPVLNPKGWDIDILDNLTKQITDGTHKSPPMSDFGYKYITAKHIKEGNLIDFDSKPTYVEKEYHDEIYSRCSPELGDILYIKDGATTGIACVNKIDEPFSLLSSVALLKPSEEVNSEYLMFFLNISKNKLIKNMAGGAIKRLTLKKIKKIKIPKADKTLQDKFATIVQQVEATKAHYQDSLDELNTLFASLSQRAFKGELDLNEGKNITTSSSTFLDELMVAEPSVGYGQVNAMEKV